EHVAVRREQHRPRIVQSRGEERDLEPGRQVKLRAGRLRDDDRRIARRRRGERFGQLLETDVVVAQRGGVRRGGGRRELRGLAAGGEEEGGEKDAPHGCWVARLLGCSATQQPFTLLVQRVLPRRVVGGEHARSEVARA